MRQQAARGGPGRSRPDEYALVFERRQERRRPGRRLSKRVEDRARGPAASRTSSREQSRSGTLGVGQPRQRRDGRLLNARSAPAA